MRRKHSFSLTELLAVVALILILVSLLIVTVGEMYGVAGRLRCQQKLEQIGHACQLFSNANDGRELRCLDLLGKDAARWYEKLLPFFGVDTVEAGKQYLNCPAADLVETSGAGIAGRGQDRPILLYASGDAYSYNRYYQLRAKLNEFWPGGCHWTTYSGGTNPDNIDDHWLWQQNGLETYSEFWYFGVISNTECAFGQATPDPDPERVREFRERDGGGLFLVGDHTYPNPDGYGVYNHGLNKLADHCKLGICIHGGRPHNANVTWSGHEIGAGIAPEPGPATLPEGRIYLSIGRVTYDNRADDERKQRQKYASFPFVCRGPQPAGGSGISYPACTHTQDENNPCGIIGVMDDGMGRVCIDGTFTRWYDNYQPFSGSNGAKLGPLIEGIATWLSGGRGRGGDITYGYNNQIGLSPQGKGLGPSVPQPGRTIRVLDYMFYEADHDGKHGADDDATCIAPRHGGRANVLFADGHVEALTPEEIMDAKKDYWSVFKKK